MSRRVSRRALAVVAGLVVSLVAPLTMAGPAVAATELPLDVATDLLTVQASAAGPAHIVVAGSYAGLFPGRFGVVVTGADGTDPVSVPDLPHVGSVALAPDGRTVWAASRDGALGSFLVDDPTTVRSYSTGTDYPCPYDLAVASDGKVWFTYGCDTTTSNEHLAVLDPSDGTVVPISSGVFADPGPFDMQLQNSPLAPDSIAVLDAPGGRTRLLSVDGDTITASSALPGQAESVAFAADGTSLVLGMFDTAQVLRYSVAQPPAVLDTYAVADHQVDAVALSPDDAYLAAQSFGSWFSVSTYGPSSSGLLQSYPLDSQARGGGRGVAWLGNTLVSTTSDFSSAGLHLEPHATDEPTTVSLDGPASGSINQPVTLTGSLTARGSAVGDAALMVTRSDAVGTVRLADATTGPLGRFVIHDTPPNGKVATYRVSYAGGDQLAPSSATHAVPIARYATYLSIATDAKYYFRAQVAHLTVHLGPTYTARRVAVYATPAQEPQQLIALRAVDGAGYLHLNYAMYRNTTFVVKFFGDARHLPVAHSAYRATGVGLSLGLHHWYAQSGNYRLYHSTTAPKMVETVTPNKSGQCGYFYFEMLSAGKWKELGLSQCFRLDYSSTAVAYFTGDHTAGRRYRVAALWFKGDGVNTTTGSDWHYFRFTS